jgi:hypothetical protein
MPSRQAMPSRQRGNHRASSRQKFEAALNTQGKYISPVLLELGWRRKWIWSTTGQYNRYWEPLREA